MRVAGVTIAVIVAIDRQIIVAFGQAQFFTRDARDGFKRRARATAALRAMTIGGVTEAIFNLISHRAAQALAFERILRGHDIILRVSDRCYAVDLDVEVPRPRRHADKNAGRGIFRKISRIDGVDRRKLFNRRAIDIALENVFH